MFGGDDILMQRMGTLKTEFVLFGEPSCCPQGVNSRFQLIVQINLAGTASALMGY